MKIDRVIDILNKWEFFYGQRAGRKLWAEKPTEVQDEDISNFCRDLGLVREALERTRWIPCSERLPEKNDQWVLCLCVSGAIEVLKFDYTMWNWDAQYPGRCYMENYVTNWMPLPEFREEDRRSDT